MSHVVVNLERINWCSTLVACAEKHTMLGIESKRPYYMYAGRSVTHVGTSRSTTHAGRSITHAGRSRSTIVHTGKSNITPTYVLLWIRGRTRPCSWTWRSMPSIGVSTSAAAGRPRPWQSEKWLPPSRRSAGRACRSRLTAAMLIPPLRTER